jgi:signal transduction histidine kinase
MAGVAIAGPNSPQQAVSQERQRLARELHDGLAQSVGLMAQQAELLTRLSQRDRRAALAEAVALRQSVQHSLEELKSVVLGLQPPTLEPGLEMALHHLASSVARYYNVKVRFQARGDTTKLPAPWELPLYRIAQEAVSNAVRHGQAQRVEVVLSVEPPLLSLSVQDDGRGFDPAPVPGHRGLAHMKQRAQALGGSLHLQSSPGEGTTITTTVPLSSAG